MTGLSQCGSLQKLEMESVSSPPSDSVMNQLVHSGEMSSLVTEKWTKMKWRHLADWLGTEFHKFKIRFNQLGQCSMYPHASPDETMRIREAFKKRKKKVWIFSTPPGPPSPPLKCGNTFRGGGKFFSIFTLKMTFQPTKTGWNGTKFFKKIKNI